MKKLKRILSILLTSLLILSLTAGSAFAKKKDEDESDDYSVSDVFFEVNSDSIKVGWSVGDGECKYSVQLYDSSKMKSKDKVGSAKTASYASESCDVTDLILQHGSGTYYAVVTCKKKPSGERSYASETGSETIYSEDLSEIRKNRKAQSENTEKSGLSEPGQAAEKKDSEASSASKDAAGTWKETEGVWRYYDTNGQMAVSRWIRDAANEKLWYYVDANGAMLTNTTTPDGYYVDASGRWFEDAAAAINDAAAAGAAEGAQAAEETPAAVETPAVEGTPVIEETPVVEETPETEVYGSILEADNAHDDEDED